MENMGIDINTAAKAKLAKFYADPDFDWSDYRYIIDFRYAEALSVNIH